MTSEVVAGTYSTGALTAGTHQDLTLKIKTKSSVAHKSKECLVEVLSSGDSSNADTVKAKVSVT